MKNNNRQQGLTCIFDVKPELVLELQAKLLAKNLGKDYDIKNSVNNTTVLDSDGINLDNSSSKVLDNGNGLVNQSNSLKEPTFISDCSGTPAHAFLKDINCIHFISIFLIDRMSENNSEESSTCLSQSMVIEINYDGGDAEMYHDLWEAHKDFFIKIFQCCEIDITSLNESSFNTLMKKNSQYNNTYFIGVRGLSVKEITDNMLLHEQAQRKYQNMSMVAGNTPTSLKSVCKEICGDENVEESLKNLSSKPKRPFFVRYGAETFVVLEQLIILFVGMMLIISSTTWLPTVQKGEMLVHAQVHGSNEIGYFIMQFMFVGMTFFIFLYLVFFGSYSVTSQLVKVFLKALGMAGIKVKKEGDNNAKARYMKNMWTRSDAVTGRSFIHKKKQVILFLLGLSLLIFFVIVFAISWFGAPQCNYPESTIKFCSKQILINAAIFSLVCGVVLAVLFFTVREWKYSEDYIFRMLIGITCLVLFARVYLVLNIFDIESASHVHLRFAAGEVLTGMVGFFVVFFVLVVGLRFQRIHIWTVYAMLILFMYTLTTPAVPYVLIVTAAWLSLLFLIIAVIIVCFLCKLRSGERIEVPHTPIWENGNKKQILQKESNIVGGVNHLISVTNIRQSRIRRIALSVVLRFVNFVAKRISNRGKLSGIETIYFARWLKIDGGNRLLFISNYYSDWESYLDEFIDNASPGLTGIWSNTIGFPRSKWLFGGGARQEQEFKMYARNSQITSLLHCSAYHGVSVMQIQDDVYLRDLLLKCKAGHASDAECDQLLRML